MELWQEVQDILESRGSTNVRSAVPEFLFRSLIKCGHCGCAVLAQIQKAKYIYYRCSGFRGKCPERFARQEVLEDKFVAVLRRLACPKEEFDLLRHTCADGRGLMLRSDCWVVDSQGSISAYGTRAAMIHDGLALLDMGRTAHLRFRALPNSIKRGLLNLLLVRCTWANGELSGVFAEPFGLLANYVDAARVGEGAAPALVSELRSCLGQPKTQIRRLIARYNAMIRIQNESDGTASASRSVVTPCDDWMIEAA